MQARQLRIYHHFQMAAQQMKKAADQHLQQGSGISTAQAAVLAVVREQGTASQRMIAHALRLNESAVTAMVDRLMKLGLLGRQRNPQDARVWHLQLTRKGETRLHQATTAFKDINRQIETVLSPEQVSALAQALEQLIGQFSTGRDADS